MGRRERFGSSFRTAASGLPTRTGMARVSMLSSRFDARTRRAAALS
ncbi:Uncharacterised protein [Mycobacteroides abscessus subsp. abscessus]|nr:Uncharacterised protein [Mycobacteroides abscessus subsp. abscessus]